MTKGQFIDVKQARDADLIIAEKPSRAHHARMFRSVAGQLTSTNGGGRGSRSGQVHDAGNTAYQ